MHQSRQEIAITQSHPAGRKGQSSVDCCGCWPRGGRGAVTVRPRHRSATFGPCLRRKSHDRAHQANATYRKAYVCSVWEEEQIIETVGCMDAKIVDLQAKGRKFVHSTTGRQVEGIVTVRNFTCGRVCSKPKGEHSRQRLGRDRWTSWTCSLRLNTCGTH